MERSIHVYDSDMNSLAEAESVEDAALLAAYVCLRVWPDWEVALIGESVRGPGSSYPEVVHLLRCERLGFQGVTDKVRFSLPGAGWLCWDHAMSPAQLERLRVRWESSTKQRAVPEPLVLAPGVRVRRPGGDVEWELVSRHESGSYWTLRNRANEQSFAMVQEELLTEWLRGAG